MTCGWDCITRYTFRISLYIFRTAFKLGALSETSCYQQLIDLSYFLLFFGFLFLNRFGAYISKGV